MPRSTRHRPLTRTVLVLAAVAALVVAGCGGDDGGTTAGGSSGNGSGDAPATLTIGYQHIPNGDLIVKNQGWLEEALPDTEIEWKLFDSGGSVNEAFVAGSIDIGLAGSSPVSRGLSQPIAYQVPWIHAVIGEAEALVVNPDAGISELADLDGKKIATPFASTAHFSLLAALEEAGVDAGSVDIIDAEPDDIFAAWSRGDIDGAYLWNPNLASIVADGGEVLVTSAELAEQGKTTYDLAVVADDLVDSYPDVVQTWVEQQDRAVQLIQDDPEEAASIIGSELDLEADEVQDQLAGLIFLTAAEQAGDEHLNGGLAANLLAAAEFNAEQGEIDAARSAEDYQAAVNATFVEGVG